MKLIIYSLGLLFVFAFFSCNKDKKELLASPPLLLLPMHDSARLSDNDLNGIKLYYFETQQKYVPDFGRATSNLYQVGVLSTADIAALSADAGIKRYYLSFPDGIVDTLYINYESLSDDDARKNDCFCNKPLLNFTVNGHSPVIDTLSDGGNPIYIIYH